MQVERLVTGFGKDPRGQTEAIPIVREYFMRKTLSGLGYTSDLGKLPAWKADCFHGISAKLAEVQASEMEKLRQKRKR